MTEALPYLHGGLMMGCFVVGLKFLKYWRLSHDRFFIFFTAAFWIFAAGWGMRAFVSWQGEHGYFAYLPRLFAFVLILVAIFDKNRRTAKE